MNTQYIHIGGRRIVNPDNIRLMQADLNYTMVYFKDGTKVLVATTLGTIITRLPKGSFLRVNRGTVVNTKTIEKYIIRADYDLLKLSDESVLKVSRRRRIETRKLLINPSI